jgi:hypothetical protein
MGGKDFTAKNASCKNGIFGNYFVRKQLVVGFVTLRQICRRAQRQATERPASRTVPVFVAPAPTRRGSSQREEHHQGWSTA